MRSQFAVAVASSDARVRANCAGVSQCISGHFSYKPDARPPIAHQTSAAPSPAPSPNVAGSPAAAVVEPVGTSLHFSSDLDARGAIVAAKAACSVARRCPSVPSDVRVQAPSTVH